MVDVVEGVLSNSSSLSHATVAVLIHPAESNRLDLLRKGGNDKDGR